ncbi:right-handed parallel beta-helix repeat-containing protein [Listeria ilorinensis]|uniref:right-handed parallel beta-helix repeat-containing protein n=1 Tax=Listeria ilorinensis TaxID=2867439 RepID=UPI001EF5A581|nr:right-handed parallel beta-helix repeat-containing protein [Listeria ilorinensis]
MKKVFVFLLVIVLCLAEIPFLLSSAAEKTDLDREVIDLAPLIQEAGTGTLHLRPKTEVVYVVYHPIKDVQCNIEGDASGSLIEAGFKGTTLERTPSLLTFKGGRSGLEITHTTFDLKKIGRGSLQFYQNDDIIVENCTFTGYSKEYGYHTADSSIIFTDCQNVQVRENLFFDNGYQYGKEDTELNRCLTFQGDSGNHYLVENNEFTRVNQGIIVQGKQVTDCVVRKNVFNAVVDNSLYLLGIPFAKIIENDFNKDALTESPDEGVVLKGGTFYIQDNHVFNVLNKFVAVNGPTEKLIMTGNQIKSTGTTERPAVIAWRNNTAYLVNELTISRNEFDLDTAPSNYDVFPIGKVGTFTFTDNQVRLNGLSAYQYVFSFLGQEPISQILITKNQFTERQGSNIHVKSRFLRESAPDLPPVEKFVIESNQFAGEYPDRLNPSKGSMAIIDYHKGDTYLKGTYEGDIIKAQLFVNGISQGWGGDFHEGVLRYYIGNLNAFSEQDEIILVGYNEKNKELDRQTIKLAQNKETAALIPDPYETKDLWIRGKYTGQIVRARVLINGIAQAWGGTFQNGNFSYYIGLGKIKENDTVEIIGYSMENGELARTSLQVKQTSPQLVPETYQLKENYITGTYRGNMTKARLFINGSYISVGGVFQNGTFTYYIGNRVNENDQIRLVGYSSENKALVETSVKVAKSVATAEEDLYKLGELVITGSFSGNIAKARVFINGRAQAWGGTFKNGRFSYYIGNKIRQGDRVSIEYYNAKDQLLTRRAVTISE